MIEGLRIAALGRKLGRGRVFITGRAAERVLIRVRPSRLGGSKPRGPVVFASFVRRPCEKQRLLLKLGKRGLFPDNGPEWRAAQNRNRVHKTEKHQWTPGTGNLPSRRENSATMRLHVAYLEPLHVDRQHPVARVRYPCIATCIPIP
jgi:hypothetical protein